MFGVSFGELLLIALIALLVLGPDRLPGAARTAGLWIGRIKRSFNAIKADVEREIGADEIRRQLHNERILEMEREINGVKNDVLSPFSSLRNSLSDKPAAAPTTPPAAVTTAAIAPVVDAIDTPAPAPVQTPEVPSAPVTPPAPPASQDKTSQP